MREFVETNALLALLEDDPGECERLLLTMHPGELTRVYVAAKELADMALGAARIIAREGGPRSG